MVSGFECSCPLAQMRPPHIRSLYVGPQFCLQLPSDSASRWTPLAVRLAVPTIRACEGLSPSSPRSNHHSYFACAYALRAMPGAHATTAWDRLPGRCRMNCWDWTKAIATATAHGPAEFAPLGLTGWGEGRDALGLSHLTLRTTWTINFHWLDQPPFPCTSTIRRNRIRVNRCSGKSRYSKAKRLWEQRMTAPPSPEIEIAGVCSCRTGPRSISPQSNPESSRPRPSARTTGHPTACPHRCF